MDLRTHTHTQYALDLCTAIFLRMSQCQLYIHIALHCMCSECGTDCNFPQTKKYHHHIFSLFNRNLSLLTSHTLNIDPIHALFAYIGERLKIFVHLWILNSTWTSPRCVTAYVSINFMHKFATWSVRCYRSVQSSLKGIFLLCSTFAMWCMHRRWRMEWELIICC